MGVFKNLATEVVEMYEANYSVDDIVEVYTSLHYIDCESEFRRHVEMILRNHELWSV